MYKKTLRWISTLLTLTILLQLSPTAFFSTLVQTADASGSANAATGQYEYEVPQAGSSTVTTTAPDTFAEGSVSETQSVTENPFPNLSGDLLKYAKIINQYATYSQIPSTQQVFLCTYLDTTSTDLTSLENEGLNLSTSINYILLAKAFGYDLAAIVALAPTPDECSDLSAQIKLYNISIKDSLVGSILDSTLRNFIFQGFSFNQVMHAYGTSQTFNIPMSQLLSSPAKVERNPEVVYDASSSITAFSTQLGVSATAISNYLSGNSLSVEDLYDCTDDIREVKLSILDISQYTSSVPNEYDAKQTLAVNAPYVYRQNENESVSLNSGALIYESNDLVVPGVAGLDLVFGRRYNSQASNLYSPYAYTTPTSFVYNVIRVGEAYYYGSGSDRARMEALDVIIVDSYDTREEAEQQAEILKRRGYTIHYGDEYDLVYFWVDVWIEDIPTEYDYGTGLSNNSYLNDLYGLGQGWSLQFSSIDKSKDMVYLADGTAYEIYWGYTGNPRLENVATDDKEFSMAIDEFSNGSISSRYRLSYQDGKREYFDNNGRLIGIVDRYGNTVKLVHTTLNGYPCITVTDTIGREFVYSGQATEAGHIMTLTHNNEVLLSYAVTEHGEWRGASAISEYIAPDGTSTKYSYDYVAGSVDVYNKTVYGPSNKYLNLTTITHPTGAQTKYTYGKYERNYGSYGLMHVYKVASRVDIVSEGEINHTTYAYSENDVSGWPAYSNANNLPDYFTYSATVTDSLSNKTTIVFNEEDLPINSTVMNSGTQLRSAYYEYGEQKLPIKTTTRLYNASGDYIETIEAATYDSKGNVTTQWSSYAAGDTANTEHKTTYTYDTTYGIPLTQTYKTNPDTTILVENTLDAAGKNIASTKLYVNGAVKQRTDYTYDTYGNIRQQKRFHDNMTDYALAEYTYQNGAYLTQEKHTGILSADGTAAAGTPGHAAGNIVTTHTYDSLGHRLSTTAGNGNTTSYTYDAAGNVTQITNPDSTTVTYTRDYTNNKVTVTDENGAQVTYIYTPLGLEYETVDTLTNKVINRKEYDAQSRLSKYYDYVYGAVTEYTYDNLDRVISETVYQGTEILAQTTYSYDDAAENGLYQKVTKTVVGDANAPSIVTTQYTDKHGNVVKTGKFLDGVEYFDVSTYDYVGNVLTTLSAADAQKNLDYTAQYVYNETNQMVSACNALGQSTTNTYNALGQLVSTTDYAGTPTTYTYDALGRLLTQTITIQDGVTATNKYDYDPAGNIIREYKPTNAVGSAATWAKTEYSYDSRQRLAAVAQYQGSSVASVTRYTYNGVGNTLTMTTGLSSLTDTTGNTTTYTYDRFGNVLTTTDALGKVESNTYTDLGRLSSTVDRNRTTTSYAYDALGRTLAAVAGSNVIAYSYTKTGQVRSEQSGGQLTEYDYDALGRVQSVSEAPSAYTKTYTYDLAGNRTGFTVTSGGETLQSTTYTYDDLNRLSTVSEGGTLQATYTYDTNGNRATLTYANGVVESYQYNKANWITGLTNKKGSSTLSSYTYTYYTSGSQKSETTNAGVVTSYTYDDLGRLTQESETNGLTLAYTYDANGNRTQMEATTTEPTDPDPEPPTGVITLDPAGGIFLMGTARQIELPVSEGYTLPQPTRPFFNFLGWYLDDILITDDNIRQITESCTLVAHWEEGGTPILPPGTVQTYLIVYRANNGEAIESTQIQTCPVGGPVTIQENPFVYPNKTFGGWATSRAGNPVYQPGDVVTDLAAPGESVVLYAVWDKAEETPPDPDPPIEISPFILQNPNVTEIHTTTYTYDANNRLTMESKTQGGTTTTSVFTYDDNGNLLTELDATNAAVVNHSYDGFNRLISSVGTTTITYTYNAQGIRTSRQVGDTYTQYLLDGGNVVGEITNGTVTTYLRGANLISSGDSYYLYNAHGDVVQLTDSTGAVTKTYEYDAFGNEKNPSDTDTNPFRYCGEYYDTETGLYYLRARYYDPATGRFEQQDKVTQLLRQMPNGQNIVDPLSLNHYTYCHSNPILYVDPNGCWIHILIGAAVGAIAGMVIEVVLQMASSGHSGNEIDWGLVGISAFSGALGGALTATGVGAVASGAIVGGVSNLCEQVYKKGVQNVDLLELGVSAGFGAVTGFASDVFGNLFQFPEIPQSHFYSMSNALVNRIGNAVKYQLGKGAFNEIAKAISYYYSQTATLMWKTVVRTVLIEMPMDTAVNEILQATGLPQAAISEISAFLHQERGG